MLCPRDVSHFVPKKPTSVIVLRASSFSSAADVASPIGEIEQTAACLQLTLCTEEPLFCPRTRELYYFDPLRGILRNEGTKVSW